MRLATFLFWAMTWPVIVRADAPGWINVTQGLADDEPWHRFTAMTLGAASGSDTVFAQVGDVGLFSSPDGGAHWIKLTATGPKETLNGFISNFLFDPKVPDRFWTGCWYGRGVLKTSDGGKSFQSVGIMNFGEGVTVDFSDPERKTMAVGLHELPQSVFLSRDGGATWKSIGATLPEANFSSWPLLVGPHVLLVNASGFKKKKFPEGARSEGIYRTEDDGVNWSKVSDLAPLGTPLLTSKGDIYYPIKHGLAKSSDAGKTWTQLTTSTSGTIIELPDGRLAGKGYTDTGFVAISHDGGVTWTNFGPHLPVSPSNWGPSLVYLPGLKAFMVSSCLYDKKIPDAVWRLDAATLSP